MKYQSSIIQELQSNLDSTIAQILNDNFEPDDAMYKVLANELGAQVKAIIQATFNDCVVNTCTLDEVKERLVLPYFSLKMLDKVVRSGEAKPDQVGQICVGIANQLPINEEQWHELLDCVDSAMKSRSAIEQEDLDYWMIDILGLSEDYYDWMDQQLQATINKEQFNVRGL